MNRKTQPIRIAQIMGKLWSGGVESVVYNYYKAIDKEKYQFDFYYDEDSTVEPPQELIEMGARFIKIPPYQDVFDYLKALDTEFQKNHYLIVHSHINTLSVIPLFAAKNANIPIRIAHNHSVPGGNEFKRNMLKQFLKHFSKINATSYFACSEKAARWLFGNNTYEDGDVFIMKNAIDFQLYNRSIHETSKLKKKLNLNNNFVVGHVGRFTFAKNHVFILDTFKELKNLLPSAKLLLIGDGELKNEIIAKINSLGLNDSVVMTGKVDKPYMYYSLMDVLVLPSIFEGLSMTTVESQAAKKNIVVSKAVPNEAVFSNGVHYVESRDPRSWAKKLIAVANNEVYFDNQKSQYYDINKASKILEMEYEKLLNDKNLI